MSITPQHESPEWDAYPVDTTPLPEPDKPARARSIAPMAMAGAMVGMLLIAAFLAVSYSGDSAPTIDAGANTRQETLPFTSEASWTGCTPGTEDSLPDGTWFGYVTGVAGDELEFDLACHYLAEDGEELIENDSVNIRLLPVGDGAALADVGEADPVLITVADGAIVETVVVEIVSQST